MATQIARVARVAAIYRYPVKSMRGEPLTAADLGWHGLEGDRRNAFIDHANRSGFPWLTAREFAGLLRYEPRFENPADLRSSRIIVKTPGGNHLPIDSSDLLDEIARASGRSIQLFRDDSGVFDAMNISIISRRSIDSIASGVDRALDPRRFRPNILLDCDDDQPFMEDRWVGDLLVFGRNADAPRVQTNRRDHRCKIICIDPDNATTDPAILKHVAQTRSSQLGIYATAQRPGTINVGDEVFRIGL